ncbi:MULTISPECIES: bacteriocin [Helicobacter]|uniref:bacteriocin n=1 Tax=Helicobacter TaxID=209 RepID=UPI002606A7CF|nr:bacteriocin [Helicobacter sp. UBA3407]
MKVLNDEEMKQVVGGARVTSNFIKHYGVMNNYGQNIYYTAYYPITLETYMDTLYINLVSSEVAAVEATYDFRINKVSTSIVAINTKDYVNMRYLNTQAEIKDFNRVDSWIRQDKINIKYFK